MAIVYILGAAQGLFLAAILASRSPRTTPNRLLALAMIAFSVDLVTAWYHTAGLDQQAPQFIGLDAGIGFLYGPLWFLYARTLTTPAHALRRIDYLHFLPFLLALLVMIPFYRLDGAAKLADMMHPDHNRYLILAGALAPFKIGFGALYIGWVLVLIRRHRRRIRWTHSMLDHVQLNWVRNVTYGFVLLLVLSFVLYLVGKPTAEHPVGMDPSTIHDDIALIALAVMVYLIGYFGLRQPEILLPKESPPPETPTHAGPANPDKPSYAKSGMEPDTAREIKERLCAVMERDRLYRNGQLTLVDLAGALDISPHNLTEVLNTQLGLNFYDFVNGYRVREAKERLDDPACAHLTVLAIGLDAGFNSKSSFNAVFKKHTQRSPSAYRDRESSAADANNPAGTDA